ncbi:hypothetical protein [Pontibacter qinzhouensis]|uniref:hypothetical protein n=1 Tax=Pontibacter qinzhouensis TaxID=2603253 RepID=UPI001C9D05ED|nr:hypothetical protein [Pontibacter qinzhouensis]
MDIKRKIYAQKDDPSANPNHLSPAAGVAGPGTTGTGRGLLRGAGTPRRAGPHGHSRGRRGVVSSAAGRADDTARI